MWNSLSLINPFVFFGPTEGLGVPLDTSVELERVKIQVSLRTSFLVSPLGEIKRAWGLHTYWPLGTRSKYPGPSMSALWNEIMLQRGQPVLNGYRHPGYAVLFNDYLRGMHILSILINPLVELP